MYKKNVTKKDINLPPVKDGYVRVDFTSCIAPKRAKAVLVRWGTDKRFAEWIPKSLVIMHYEEKKADIAEWKYYQITEK